nr:ATP synthase subunit 8 [Cloresmus antennatus]
MPQMSPMWWEILFIFFILSFMLMITIMFFNTDMKPKKSKEVYNEPAQLKWKW